MMSEDYLIIHKVEGETTMHVMSEDKLKAALRENFWGVEPTQFLPVNPHTGELSLEGVEGFFIMRGHHVRPSKDWKIL